MTQELTIDTLEKMFVYLGCANIETKVAMDGAIPVESVLQFKQHETIAEYNVDKLVLMPPNWRTKFIWFANDDLNLSTVSNVHWASFYKSIRPILHVMTAMGQIQAGNYSRLGFDAAFDITFSRIDKFGRFVKFPVDKFRRGGVVVQSIYNPSFLLCHKDEKLFCIKSSSDDLLKQFQVFRRAPFLCGLSQSIGNYWRVETKFEEVCPSLTMLTDPTGVKEFWRLRDVPEGRKRRDALLHWVESHWRKTRNDPDVEAYVRKHLRGQQDLTQGKFQAKIHPSERDNIHVETLKDERETMRKLKTDRRLRKKILTSKAR